MSNCTTDVATGEDEMHLQNQLILATIHSNWMAIDRSQAIRCQSTNSLRQIIEELRNNSEKYSQQDSQKILAGFKHLFASLEGLSDDASAANKVDSTQFFKNQRFLWINVMITAFTQLNNCFWRKTGRIYEELTNFFDASRIDTELTTRTFDPKDYYSKLIDTLKTLAAPSRDPLISELDIEIIAMKRFSEIEKFDEGTINVAKYSSEENSIKKRITDYIKSLQQIFSKIIDLLCLMQIDILCFSLQLEMENKEKEGSKMQISSTLIDSEKRYFDQILQLEHYMRTGNLIEIEKLSGGAKSEGYMKSLVREIPVTAEWLKVSEFELPRAWMKLLLFEFHRVPEICHSMRMEIAYLASMVATYIKICCLFCNIKQIFKENDQRFTVDDSTEFMKCIRLVMCSDTMNILDNNIERIVGIFYAKESGKKIAGVKREYLTAQFLAVCNTKSPIHKLMKERFRNYFEAVLKSLISERDVKYEPESEDEDMKGIEELMPAALKDVRITLKGLVKEAVDELRMHRIIYHNYYDYILSHREI